MPSKVKLLRRAAILGAALAALTLALAVVGPGVAGATSNAKTALIDGQTVTFADEIMKGGEEISLEQFAAEQAGYTVTVKSGDEWETMTASEFASYQVLIVGDPFCGGSASSESRASPSAISARPPHSLRYVKYVVAIVTTSGLIS